MRSAYQVLRTRAESLFRKEWTNIAPLPTYYTYPLLLSPHPFMGLGKFVAGRIHQMRPQQGYLAAHRS